VQQQVVVLQVVELEPVRTESEQVGRGEPAQVIPEGAGSVNPVFE
jgi:hypothetical protein